MAPTTARITPSVLLKIWRSPAESVREPDVRPAAGYRFGARQMFRLTAARRVLGSPSSDASISFISAHQRRPDIAEQQFAAQGRSCLPAVNKAVGNREYPVWSINSPGDLSL